MTERISPTDEPAPEEPSVAFSGPPYSVEFTVYRTAPLRVDPFVKRSSNPLEIRPDDNVVEWIHLTGGGHITLRAWFQARAQRIDSTSGGHAIWNDFWLYTRGPGDHVGWISMVDVLQGHDGEPLADLEPAPFAYQYGSWAPVVWSF